MSFLVRTLKVEDFILFPFFFLLVVGLLSLDIATETLYDMVRGWEKTNESSILCPASIRLDDFKTFRNVWTKSC